MRVADVSGRGSLWEVLLRPGGSDSSLHVWEDGGYRRTSWAEVIVAATSKAAGLKKLGVGAGEPVACVLTNQFDVGTAMIGIWLAGGVVVSLPTPARGMPIMDYATQLRELMAIVDARLMVIEQQFAAMLPDDVFPGVRVIGADDIGGGSGSLSPPGDDDVALIQFSSGTTAEPKGCMLSPGAMAAQLEMLSRAADIDPQRDRGVMWLPMSHDMGLFGGILLAFWNRIDAALSTPQRFLASPRTWLEDCVQFGATLTVGPTFALSMALRGLESRAPAGAIPIRRWIVGSDRLEWPIISSAAEGFAPYGVDMAAFCPAYGLAEATLAVTFSSDGGPQTLTVDSGRLLDGEVHEVEADAEGASRLVSSGVPLAGVTVRIDSASGGVGEIAVRSPSLSGGYVAQPELTATRFASGELRTGDVGFVHDGHLYVVGRLDDMVSIGGRNVDLAAVEAAVLGAPEVAVRGLALVDVISGDKNLFVALVEVSDSTGPRRPTAHAIRRLAAASAGIRLSECIFLDRGSLPKSPSGKVQRYRCRTLVSRAELSPIERVSV